MLRIGVRARCWSVLWAGLVAAQAATALGEEPRGTRWVAPDAFLYAESAHPDRLLDRALSDHVQGLLKAVPGYEKGLDRPDIRQAREVARFVASQLGTTWDEALRSLAGNGMVLAAEGETKPERVFLVITPRDAAFLDRAHAKVVELARADAASKGKPDPIEEFDHRGVAAYNVSPEEAHAIVEGTLVIANGKEALKAVIDRALDGVSASIADDPTFAEHRKQAGDEVLAWSFARTDRLRAMDPKRYGKAPDPGAVFLLGPWIQAAEKGDWATLGMTWTDKILGAELTIAAPKDGYSDAMQRYLPGPDEGASRPLSVPNAIASGSLWRDFSSIWEVRAEIFPPETVQGLAQLDTQAGTFFGGRDFGTGVLGALGNHWNFVVADQDFEGAESVPDVKYPAFALVMELKPDDEEFATRLKSAFQSFIGLVNLGAAQTRAQPLMLGSETVDGVTIATSRYLPEKNRPEGEPVHARYNFAPSAVQVGNSFVISSNLQLARDLVKTLRAEPAGTDHTLVAGASGPALAAVLERNLDRIVMQNMLEKGNTKEQAEGEARLLLDLLRYLGKGKLTATDTPASATLKLEFQLDAK